MNSSKVTAARSSIRDYVRIARVDHWFKNVFMIPGAAVALVLTQVDVSRAIWPFLLGFASTCLVASANYVINEWLDAEFDRHHPLKKGRPSAAGRVEGRYVLLEYLLLLSVGLAIASFISKEFLIFSIALLVMGILYNVRPMRTKDIAYLDVLSESINNPLRFLLGWATIASGLLPPSSILLAYWMGGAYLMAIKRYAEYRYIGDPTLAGRYRRSFQFYSEERLLVSAFFYALSSAFFLGIFLVKYRVEFLLSFPFFALLFAWYLSIGMQSHSPTQNPEKLYKESGFIAYLLFLATVVGLLFVIDIPWLHMLLNKTTY